MIFSDNYMISEIAGSKVAIPVGQNIVDLSVAIELKGAAAYICECLAEELTLEELKDKLYSHYGADSSSDKATIDSDLQSFLEAAAIKKLIV